MIKGPFLWMFIIGSDPILLNPIPIPIGYELFYFFQKIKTWTDSRTYKIKDLLIQQVKYYKAYNLQELSLSRLGSIILVAMRRHLMWRMPSSHIVLHKHITWRKKRCQFRQYLISGKTQ